MNPEQGTRNVELFMNRILIAGVSTRAAAESAARAGFVVTAIDAFGDLDQHPEVRSLSLPHNPASPFTAHAAADAVRAIDADAAVYLSPFENHARAVDDLAAGRALWGNPPDVLRRVRDPFLLAGVLRRRGFATPITRVDVPRESTGRKEWLVKPFRSGGGNGVRPWAPGTRVESGFFAQERISGVPASIVFVAAGGRAVPLGVSLQLVGDEAFGASGFRYCGNVLPPAGDPVLTDRVVESAIALAQCVAAEFGLVGLNGLDCIMHDEVPYVIEVNPRWCSSMELVERHYGLSMFGVHAAACADSVLPAFDLARERQSRPAIGKAIVFARADAVAGDTRSWLDDDTIRDIPKPEEPLNDGQPVCTVIAAAADAASCRAALISKANGIYRSLGSTHV